MTSETQYAQALHALIEKKPEHASEYLSNLKKVLERRGHQKLLPRIYSAYQRIAEEKKRLSGYKKITPESNRTRVLLELYRNLLAVE